MEAAFFAIDIIGIVLLVYWSIGNDELGPDASSVGLFAYRDTIGGPTEGPTEGPMGDPAEGPGRPGLRGRDPSPPDRDP